MKTKTQSTPAQAAFAADVQDFAAMEKFDLILVLKNSRLIEQGTHAQLLERKGHYYHLHQRQGRIERSHAQPESDVSIERATRGACE